MQGMTTLGDLTWPEAARLAAAGAVLAVPVGSTGQHGPPLPLSTDTDVAVALAARLATRLGNVIVAPAGGSGPRREPSCFAGAVSFGPGGPEMIVLGLA